MAWCRARVAAGVHAAVEGKSIKREMPQPDPAQADLIKKLTEDITTSQRSGQKKFEDARRNRSSTANGGSTPRKRGREQVRGQRRCRINQRNAAIAQESRA